MEVWFAVRVRNRVRLVTDLVFDEKGFTTGTVKGSETRPVLIFPRISSVIYRVDSLRVPL